MKIGIISGSHRNPSQSEKVANHLDQCLKNLEIDTWFYSLASNPLPLWDQSIWEGDKNWVERLDPLKQALKSCDGFVVVSPEWHGQVPSGLKNFFLMFGHAELGHKPALLAAVSAGEGGAYPIAELRMSSYKNNRICYLPEHLILRNVEKVLNVDARENDESLNAYYRQRIDWVLQILIGYTKALKPMRESVHTAHEKFPFGM